ncbi:LysR family transcriptional regulator [Serratia sp. M24T3]|uniref:LysR family transcriptional regulator n=1 Tax=Serratia sp. M24T3 TaxID=932213 RepID=UPI001ED952D7|nr:LysR family transcriptional regulator [Serratia sp. M24T3]
MQIFVQVVESGAFIRAAEALGMPKSTVTRQIQALETELKVKLLHRSSRRLRLTHQGEQYYNGVRPVIEQIRMLDDSLKRNESEESGQLRIELPGALACHLVIPWLPEFMTRYPHIQVQLSTGNRASDLIEQQIDCVIRIGPIRNDLLIARSLGELRMTTCASPDYLRRTGIPTHPAQLQGHQLIQVRSPQTGRSFEHAVSHIDGSVSLKGPWELSVNDASAALAAAEAGIGIVHTYKFLTTSAVSEGRLVPLFTKWQPDAVPVHIAWPENRHVSSRVRLFIDWIRVQFSRLE